MHVKGTKRHTAPDVQFVKKNQTSKHKSENMGKTTKTAQTEPTDDFLERSKPEAKPPISNHLESGTVGFFSSTKEQRLGPNNYLFLV